MLIQTSLNLIKVNLKTWNIITFIIVILIDVPCLVFSAAAFASESAVFIPPIFVIVVPSSLSKPHLTLFDKIDMTMIDVRYFVISIIREEIFLSSSNS